MGSKCLFMLQNVSHGQALMEYTELSNQFLIEINTHYIRKNIMDWRKDAPYSYR